MTPIDEKIIELGKIVRVIELDKEDGTPLYEDGDRRIGFKQKELHDFLLSSLIQARQSAIEECLEITEGMRDPCMHDKDYPHNDCVSTTIYNRFIVDLQQTLKAKIK